MTESSRGFAPGFGERERDEALWLVDRALAEDLPDGDITSEALFSVDESPLGLTFVSREDGVFCGGDVVELLFERVDPAVEVVRSVADGASVSPGSALIEVHGAPLSLLRAERIALNFTQRLSGIATAASGWRALLEGEPAVLLDTRKTTPGWRYLEKYAVRAGGATNHRMNLSDGFLLKDNHASILLRGGRSSAEDWVTAMRRAKPEAFVEVEVDSREEYLAARDAGVDAVLLDNFSIEDLVWAVEDNRRSDRPILLEASGGITEASLLSVARTGVDRISVGALTHSVRSLDIGLDYRMETR